MKQRSPFGELVRRHPRQLGLSQEGLAHRINTLVEAGNAGIENRISAKTIYNHEALYNDAAQFHVPRIGTIGIYADAFSLSQGRPSGERSLRQRRKPGA